MSEQGNFVVIAWADVEHRFDNRLQALRPEISARAAVYLGNVKDNALQGVVENAKTYAAAHIKADFVRVYTFLGREDHPQKKARERLLAEVSKAAPVEAR